MKAILIVRLVLPNFIKTEEQAQDFISDLDYGFVFTNNEDRTEHLVSEIQEVEIK